jgi:hypothetical protein
VCRYSGPRTTAALAVLTLAVGVGTAAIVTGADDSGDVPVLVEPDGGPTCTRCPVCANCALQQHRSSAVTGRAGMIESNIQFDQKTGASHVDPVP